MTDALEDSGQFPLQHDINRRLAAGDAYVSTWWAEGQPISLERAVIEYRTALAHCPSDEVDLRFRVHISLADVLRLQFEEGLGGKDDEEDLFQEALNLAESTVAGTHPSSTLHLDALRALGEVLFRRFHTKEHLQRATNTLCSLVDLLSLSQPGLLIRALVLYSLALATQSDQQSTDPKLLKVANAAVDRALGLLPKGEQAPYDLDNVKSMVLALQGFSSGDLGVMDEAIRIMQSLLDRLSPTHPRVYYYWGQLGTAYARRWYMSSAVQDLDALLVARSQERKLMPRSHPGWLVVEGSYAATLHTRFLARGDLDALQESIRVSRASLHDNLTAPAGQSRLVDASVSNLAEGLTDSYSPTGTELELLDEAIDIQWENLKRVPPSRRGRTLRTISRAYRQRFLAHRRPIDLQRAYSTLEQALKLTLESPTEHAETVYAIADVLLAMYDEHGHNTCLQKAISLLRTSLGDKLLPPYFHGAYMSLLGLSLLLHAGIGSSVDDVEESTQYQKRALELLPQEDPRQCLCLFRLGLAEYQSFVITRQQQGVGNSITSFNRALSIMPLDHPNRASYLAHLSKSLISFSDLEGSGSWLVEAFERLREAATHSISWLADRYGAAIQLASVSHQRGYPSQALEAYRLAVSLLPELASVRLEDGLRVQHIARQAREVPQDAAACALELGQPEVAVELLEAGRTRLWNARRELRANLARLREVAPDLARELAQTNTALEFRPQTEATATSIAESESEGRRLHRLAARRTELINQIRSCPSFEQFLLPPKFSHLKHAAANGPVVLLNSSIYRCDAIVIQPDQKLAVIPLDNVKHDQLENEAKTLQHWLAVASRDAKARQFLEVVLQRLLDWLWTYIGSPVCTALQQFLSAPEPRRVWWCPTGALSFLPIHACGPYGRAPGMADMAVSSYTPCISALLRTHKHNSALDSASPSVLVISQPNAPGHAPLPGAMDEMVILKQIFPQSGTFLVGTEATLSTVEAHLQRNRWVHIISHGSQNSLNPLESSLALYDGPLKLSRLVLTRLPHAEFAFLSACHSAKGTTWVPDESMHLAAGVMFTGFKSVVATSWAIADQDVPQLTRDFYTYMTEKRSPPVATDAAEALHMAVRSLRKSGVPAQRWVPFIHLGS